MQRGTRRQRKSNPAGQASNSAGTNRRKSQPKRQWTGSGQGKTGPAKDHERRRKHDPKRPFASRSQQDREKTKVRDLADCLINLAGPVCPNDETKTGAKEGNRPAFHERGLTPNELAKMLRVSPDRIRAWIKSGKLEAINTAASQIGKPRFIILPSHLAAFVKKRQVSTMVTPSAPRRKKKSDWTDFYPD